MNNRARSSARYENLSPRQRSRGNTEDRFRNLEVLRNNRWPGRGDVQSNPEHAKRIAAPCLDDAAREGIADEGETRVAPRRSSKHSHQSRHELRRRMWRKVSSALAELARVVSAKCFDS